MRERLVVIGTACLIVFGAVLGEALVTDDKADSQADPCEPTPPAAIFEDTFNQANGTNDLITNEYAAWHSTEAGVIKSATWRNDGGSIFSKPIDGRQAMYTGALGNTNADKYSQIYTHSSKIRMWTQNGDYENYTVTADVKPLGWAGDAPATWSGIKFYLRRQLQGTSVTTDDDFYTAEPNIKDGSVYIQKKVGGTYYILAQLKPGSLALNTWTKIGSKIQTNADGSVTIQVLRNGQKVIEATDRGTGGPVYHNGRVGWRSDYFQYYLDDFRLDG